MRGAVGAAQVGDFIGRCGEDGSVSHSGISGLNYFSGETPVITSDGVRLISELTEGEHEFLVTEGRWTVGSIVLCGPQRLWDLNLSRSGVPKVIRIGEGNRWLLRMYTSTGSRYWGMRPGEVVTTELVPGDRLPWCFPARPVDRVPELEGVRRGFVFGDGSRVSSSTSAANFCGDKDRVLLSLFEEIGNSPRDYGSVIRITGLPGHWKTEMPDATQTASYLYGWLAGYFAADGDVDKTGRPTLASASREGLEQVRAICNRMGVGTYGIRERIRSGFGRPPSPIYLLGLMRGDLDPEFFLIPAHRERFECGRDVVERRGWTVVSAEPAAQIEEAYCLVIDDARSFTLEDHILVPTSLGSSATKEPG